MSITKVTTEQLEEQLSRQNQMIQALQSEIGIITGEKIALSIAYQEALQELEQLKNSQEKEGKKNAKK